MKASLSFHNIAWSLSSPLLSLARPARCPHSILLYPQRAMFFQGSFLQFSVKLTSHFLLITLIMGLLSGCKNKLHTSITLWLCICEERSPVSPRALVGKRDRSHTGHWEMLLCSSFLIMLAVSLFSLDMLKQRQRRKGKENEYLLATCCVFPSLGLLYMLSHFIPQTTLFTKCH